MSQFTLAGTTALAGTGTFTKLVIHLDQCVYVMTGRSHNMQLMYIYNYFIELKFLSRG